jgi:hypothetical protein
MNNLHVKGLNYIELRRLVDVPENYSGRDFNAKKKHLLTLDDQQ